MKNCQALVSFLVVAQLSLSPMAWGQQQNVGYGRSVGLTPKTGIESPERDVKSFGSAKKSILGDEQQLPQSLMGTQTTLGAGLFYSVHVLGEVMRPGTYKINPSDRVTDALKQAGHVLPNGSERTVQLRRAGSNQILDLFSYKYHGDLNQNPYLNENDVVFVPVKGGEFEIEGPVNRPGNYEIKGDTSLAKAIDMGGGLAAGFSQKEPVRIVRFNEQEAKEVVEVVNSPESFQQTTIQKGDVVVIPHVLIANKTFDYSLKRIPGDNIFYPTVDDNVYVTGAVLQPGAFPFEPNFSYKEYVSLAGATESSKLKSVKLVRRDGKKIKATRKTEINPGDTIVVPQKYWKAETVASWLSTVTSITLSSIVIIDRLEK